jgi:hypothetical protein
MLFQIILLAFILGHSASPAASPGSSAASPDGSQYLGVIERIDERPTWVRVAFKRTRQGDWEPALRSVQSIEQLHASSTSLPEKLAWRMCRDGRALDSVASERRAFELYSEHGTQALKTTPRSVSAATFDRRFMMYATSRAARPFVISTLPDTCNIGLRIQLADKESIGRLVASTKDGSSRRVVGAKGWQIGQWTIVEIEREPGKGWWAATVVFAKNGEIRRTVRQARVVDWLTADGDDVPDVMLRTTGDNADGYTLVYGSFEKQAVFSWSYH